MTFVVLPAVVGSVALVVGRKRGIRSLAAVFAAVLGLAVVVLLLGRVVVADEAATARTALIVLLVLGGIEALAALSTAALHRSLAHEIELSPGRVEIVVHLARWRGPPWSAPLREPPVLRHDQVVLGGRELPAWGLTPEAQEWLVLDGQDLRARRLALDVPASLADLVPPADRRAGLSDWAWEAVTWLAVSTGVRLLGTPLVALAVAKLDRVAELGGGSELVVASAVGWLAWTAAHAARLR
jgi:hypothetical protein